MALSEQDRTDVNDLINSYGHHLDAGRLDEACGLLTADVTYDVSDLGALGPLRGAAAVREAALALGDANPVGHHVTNIVITEVDDRSVRVRSKGIGVMADGTSGSVVYEDVVVRLPVGWRIRHRTVIGRRAPLERRGDGPREVLDRWRDAAVRRSQDDMWSLYAVDAVHEFPFAYPGVPTRLEGRDEIVNWMASGWSADVPRYRHYRTLAVHDTSDPGTIVVEQEAVGSTATGGDFALPNIVVLTVRDGRIVRLRDYVDVLAAAAAMGHEHPVAAP